MGAELLRILYLVHEIPWPKQAGHHRRFDELVTAFAAWGEVHVLGFQEEPAARAQNTNENAKSVTAISGRVRIRSNPWLLLSALLKSAIESLPFSIAKFHSSPMEKAVQDALSELKPDLIVSCIQMAQYVPRDWPNWILDSHNVESEIWDSLARHSPRHLRLFARRESKLVSRYETEQWARAGAVISISPRDQGKIRVFQPNVFWVPVTVETPPESRANPIWDIGLIGAWNWLPNADGLEWFIEEMLPALGDYSVVVAGPGIRKNIARRLRTAGATILGFIPSSERFYGQISMTIAPYRTGGGVRMKVAEALSCGTPIIGTELAFAGIDAHIPPSLIIGTDMDLAPSTAWILNDIPTAEMTARTIAKSARERGHTSEEQAVRLGLAIKSVI